MAAGIDLHLQRFSVGESDDCPDRFPPDPNIQKLERKCFSFTVSLDPTLPEPRLFGWSGQDDTYASVTVYDTEEDAQEVAAAPEPKGTLTPAAEGWRIERAGNFIVLYRNERIGELVRSALSRLELK